MRWATFILLLAIFLAFWLLFSYRDKASKIWLAELGVWALALDLGILVLVFLWRKMKATGMQEDEKKFTGRGFDRGDFTEEERAQMRERAYFFDRNFLSLEEFLKESGLKSLALIANAAPAFLKWAGYIAALGGLGVLAIELGWL